jgi:glutaredoxin 3
VSWSEHFRFAPSKPYVSDLTEEQKAIKRQELLEDADIVYLRKSRSPMTETEAKLPPTPTDTAVLERDRRPLAEVFSKPNCPYCVKAKHLLEKAGFEIDEQPAIDHRDVLIERVTRDTGAPPRTVPQIWIDGKYIGGHDQLVVWLAAN